MKQPAVGSSTELFWRSLNEDISLPEYNFGTRRTTAPSATLRKIRPLLKSAGISRLADLTGLDWIGIPVYQAVRPNSRNLSVSQGKGLTRLQAKVSAAMESLETFHAEVLPGPSVHATVRAMIPEIDYDPYALALSTPTYLSNEVTLEWIPAVNLLDGKSSWIPKQLCELNYNVAEQLYVPMFEPTSNGLASGNTVCEAVVHGLCEVIERDSVGRSRESNSGRGVALKSVDAALPARVLERFFRAGMHVGIVDATGPAGVPCFEARAYNEDFPDGFLGWGCHLSRSTALLRALTEAAQSRLTQIAGTRDDLDRWSYSGTASTPVPRLHIANDACPRSFRDVPTLPLRGWSAQVRDLAQRVRALSGMSPLAIDLSRPEFGIPVVFVVAPGLKNGHIVAP